jgi:hypothetical protein
MAATVIWIVYRWTMLLWGWLLKLSGFTIQIVKKNAQKNSQRENIVDGLDYEIFVMHHAFQ